MAAGEGTGDPWYPRRPCGTPPYPWDLYSWPIWVSRGRAEPTLSWHGLGTQGGSVGAEQPRVRAPTEQISGVAGAPGVCSLLISSGKSRLLNEPLVGDGFGVGARWVAGAARAAGSLSPLPLPRLLGWGRTSFDFAVRDGLSRQLVGVQREAGGAAGAHLSRRHVLGLRLVVAVPGVRRARVISPGSVKLGVGPGRGGSRNSRAEPRVSVRWRRG